jgi:hypothetical protein
MAAALDVVLNLQHTHARVSSQSRPRGCSALNAQCAGDFWAGPGCCAVDLGCIWQSKAFSKCMTCPKLYEQWCVTFMRCVNFLCFLTHCWLFLRSGGMEPGTSNKWSKPSCCPGGAYCKQINNYYHQCVKNGS